MKKRSFKMPLYFLLVGIILGGLVRALENFVAEELIGLLRKEIAASCACTLKYDSLRISLLTLHGHAKNMSILEEGEAKLVVPHVHADFSLKDISNRQLLLNLKLLNPRAYGVGPDSVTYRFVDHLSATPASDDADAHSDSLKLKLVGVSLKHGKFSERLSASSIFGEDASLSMERNTDDDFVLRPIIGALRLEIAGASAKDNVLVKLGRASGVLTIDDDRILYDWARLNINDATVNASGTSYSKRNNLLEGNLSFQLDASSIGVTKNVLGTVHGKGDLGGTLRFPNGQGTFDNPASAPIIIPIGGDVFLPFDKITGSYEFAFTQTSPQLIIPALNAEGSAMKASLSEPIYVGDLGLSGLVKLDLDTIDAWGMKFNGVNLSVKLQGNPLTPQARITGVADSLFAGAYSASTMQVNLLLEPNKLEGVINADAAIIGPVALTGALDLNASPPRIIDRVAVQIGSNEQPAAEAGSSPPNGSNLQFTGSGNLTGELSLPGIQGEAALKAYSALVSSTEELSLNATLKDGVITATANDASLSVDAQLSSSLIKSGDGMLSVLLKDFSLERLNPSLACSTISLDATYAFSAANPLSGSGKIDVKNAALACERHRITLQGSPTWNITNGVLQIPTFQLISEYGTVATEGEISLSSGYNLKANGSTSLALLLPFLPAIDELEGNLELDSRLSGAIFEPKMNGAITLSDGRVSIESINLDGDNLSGALALDAGAVSLTNLSGSLNGGEVLMSGTINAQNLEKSEMRSEFSSISLQPNPETDVTCSGLLELKTLSSGRVGIAGTVEIESGEFRKNIDVLSVVSILGEFFFARDTSRVLSSKLPDVDLEISVKAPRDLVAITNLFGVELAADLKISGSLNAPIVTGEMSTLSGWLGFKERAFEITSGRIIFKPDTSDPSLEFVGESYFRSRDGDNILVILTASGSLSAPRIALNSERGMSQKEVLDLITTGFAAPRSTGLSRLSGQLELSDKALLGKDPLTGTTSFIRELTALGSVSLEPSFNPLSGVNEPAIVARKRITDNVSVVGESFLGSSTGGARGRVLYDLTPAFNIAGIIDTLTARERTSLGVDATYTVLARYFPFLTVEMTGTNSISERSILEEVKLHHYKRIPIEQFDSVEEQILSMYRDQGYFETALDGRCEGQDGFCRHISLTIHEGSLSKVVSLVFDQDPLPESLSAKGLDSLQRNAPASRETLDHTVGLLTRALRREGYLGARVSARYQDFNDGSGKELVVSLRIGNPVTFIFEGNTKFTAEEFLETLNLFERRQPFGNNTVNILTQNIERKYRELGFLYAAINYTKTIAEEDGRITYTIKIDEGAPIPVSAVTFEGNNLLNNDRIRSVIEDTYPLLSPNIFSPHVALAEEIENNLSLLREVLNKEGFPHASVSYLLIPNENATSVEIRYEIQEEARVVASSITVEHLPSDVALPDIPAAPISIPKINQFVEQLGEALNERGYINRQISVTFEADGTPAVLEIEPGFQVIIESIEISGNLNIERKRILESLPFKAGAVWDSNDMIAARNKLLSLGLFSRVELVPADTVLDSAREELLVRVEERPLQFLEVGAGLNSEYGFHVFGDATDRSLFKDGRAISLRLDSFYDAAEGEVSQGVANLTYSDPEFVPAQFALTEDIRYQKLDLSTQEFNLDRISLNSYLYHEAAGPVTYSFGHTILQENLEDVSPGAVLDPKLDTGNVNLSHLAGVLNYDRRDSPLNPTRGFNAGADAKLSLSQLGSDADYAALGLKFSFLLPLGQRFSRYTLASNARAASSWSFDESDDIPISQRYYLGGRNSIRGFRENTLGPTGADGSVIGGDILLSNNLELRYQTTENTSVHIFFDTGSVFLRDIGVSLNDFRESAGVGIRYLSPVGPVGFDVGHPLDEQPGEPSLRVHFALGSSF